MKKSEFKQLLKECLIEILTEEPAVKKVFKEVLTRPSQPSQPQVQAPKAKTPNARRIAEQLAGVDSEEDNLYSGMQIENPMLKEHVNSLASQAANGNKKQAELMKAIFADTAATTLQEQLNNENGMGGNDLNSKGVDLENFVDLGDMKRWADIAFTKK